MKDFLFKLKEVSHNTVYMEKRADTYLEAVNLMMNEPTGNPNSSWEIIASFAYNEKERRYEHF